MSDLHDSNPATPGSNDPVNNPVSSTGMSGAGVTTTTAGDLSARPPLQPTAQSVLSTRVPSTIVYAVGVLMFLLPFIEIRCNSVPFAKFSGVQLATGFKIEAPGTNNTVVGRLEETSEGKGGHQNDGNVYAIVALALSLLSLGLAFANARSGISGALITGILAGISLIGLMVNIKKEVATEVTTGDDGVVIGVFFTPWFYLAILAAFMGAFFCFRRLGYFK
ncbi:MAG: hypothetical protein ABWZ25_06190 [Chitinophagaceae bacterium]